MDCQQVNRIIRVDGSISQQMGSAETVTISLEDAAQIILQEQVMDGTLQIPPGTYHILTQDTLDENRLIVAGSDGMPVIMQSTGDGLQNYTVHTEDGEANISEVVNTVVSDSSSMDILQVGEQTEDLQLPQQTSLNVAAAEPVGEEAEGAAVIVGVGVGGGVSVRMKAEAADVTPIGLTSDNMNVASSTEQDQSEDQSNQMTEAYPSTADEAVDAATAAATAAAIQSRKPDLSCPIAVTDRTEVVINGKKCVMMLNSETGQMCAYPLLPPEGRRKRGRPRKQPRIEETPLADATEPTELPMLMPDSTIENTLLLKTPLNGTEEWTASQQTQSIGVDAIEEMPLMSQEMLAQTEQTNAAEGLLELSATGPDGVRRSGRIRRKAKTLEDYEILEISSEDEGATAPDDEEVTPVGLKRKRVGVKESNSLAPFLLGPGMKRGRGRPRRYPPAGQSNLPTQIPAVIIPTSNGQTLMMASVPGIQNIQAFQQINQLPTLIQKPLEGQVMTEDNNNQMLAVSLNTEGIIMSDSTPKQQQEESLIISADGNHISADDNTTQNTKLVGSTDINEEISNVHSKTAENSTDEAKNISEPSTEVVTSSAQPTIIQIPDNFLPIFLPKKDPIKIGLKAMENDLERLRCNKCQFQAYYQQQFQEHLSTNHPETVQKCKCCTYLSLDKTDLYNHFKENHPRCLCHVCGFTSEHAYVIKRHMMRHSADGCTCELCGKTYKDQYILKMHVKMVHLPAEVLYECTICAKKFTRKAHLKRHLRIHDPEKPYKCPHCEYRGCERSDISKHVLIHDEPKHICEVCGKAFRHIKNKELHVKRHKGQRDYKCGVCDFFGYTFTDIRKHIERKHSDMKTLVCDKCGQTFRNEGLLIEHQKQKCEVTMIEQALTIATSTGTTEARIQIPTSLSVDGQHITIGSQQIPLDTSQQMNITVEQLNLAGNPEDSEITLTESNSLGGSEIAVASQTDQFEDIGEDPGCVLTEGTEVAEEEEEEEEEEEGEKGGEGQENGAIEEEESMKELEQNLTETLMKHHLTVPISQTITAGQMTFVMTTSTMTPTTGMVTPVVGHSLSEFVEGVVQASGLPLGLQVEEATTVESTEATVATATTVESTEATVATEATTVESTKATVATEATTVESTEATVATATTTTTTTETETTILAAAAAAVPTGSLPLTTTVTTSSSSSLSSAAAETIMEAAAEVTATTTTTTTAEVEAATAAVEVSESEDMNETVNQQQHQQQITVLEPEGVALTEVDPSSADGEPAANMVIS